MDNEKMTILVAEDDATTYRLDDMILNKKFNVIHAWDGKEAVAMAAEFKPDIILMDIRMPNMDGIAATKQIKEVDPKAVIVALTSFAYDDEKEKYENYGFDGLLTKPCHSDVLLSSLLDILLRKRQLLFLG